MDKELDFLCHFHSQSPLFSPLIVSNITTLQSLWELRVTLIAFPFTPDSISEANISSRVPGALLLLSAMLSRALCPRAVCANHTAGLSKVKYDPSRDWTWAGVGVGKAARDLIRSCRAERYHRAFMNIPSLQSRTLGFLCGLVLKMPLASFNFSSVQISYNSLYS